MPAGSVHVHNYNVNQVIRFEVEGSDVGKIDSWKSEGDDASRYQPGSLTVPRLYPTGDPTLAGFKPGENLIQIVWPSFVSQGVVTLPDLNHLPIDHDLVLILTKGTIILVTADTGTVLEVAKGTLPGGEAAAVDEV